MLIAAPGLGASSASLSLWDTSEAADVEWGGKRRPVTLSIPMPFQNICEDHCRLRLRRSRLAPPHLIVHGARVRLDLEPKLGSPYTLIDEAFPEQALFVPSTEPTRITSAIYPAAHLQRRIAETTYALAKASGMPPAQAELARPEATHYPNGHTILTFPFFEDHHDGPLAYLVLTGEAPRSISKTNVQHKEAA